MSSKFTNCKLCKNIAEIRKSHIIPEFIYRPLYDKDIHRFHSFSSHNKLKPKYLQKGIWEKLLCDDCEQKLGQYEKYMKENFFDNPNIKAKQKGDHLIVSNLDYSKFKLFQLSILWRMSVAEKIGFEKFSLSKDEEIIRNMLIHDKPGNIDEYGCIMFYMADPEVNLNGLIITPESFINNGINVLRVVFGGFTWIYFLSRFVQYKNFKSHFITLDGRILILLRIARNMKFLRGHAEGF